MNTYDGVGTPLMYEQYKSTIYFYFIFFSTRIIIFIIIKERIPSHARGGRTAYKRTLLFEQRSGFIMFTVQYIHINGWINKLSTALYVFTSSRTYPHTRVYNFLEVCSCRQYIHYKRDVILLSINHAEANATFAKHYTSSLSFIRRKY
jgi:hypothetical protein